MAKVPPFIQTEFKQPRFNIEKELNMENNTHEGIANSKHKSATEAQVKYLVYL